jgi:hypothetical protein
MQKPNIVTQHTFDVHFLPDLDIAVLGALERLKRRGLSYIGLTLISIHW